MGSMMLIVFIYRNLVICIMIVTVKDFYVYTAVIHYTVDKSNAKYVTIR